ncbi:MAG TPA: efflux RND transporter periplasmic adaptor subunit [Polyangiaceae bacterium]|nr:efflux RND transporter periplasmic adaptor subunit [Polyangiaceae bacterium]
MNSSTIVVFFLAALDVGCRQSGRDEPLSKTPEHTEAKHANEVRLSAEAVSRAGIRLATAERRALTGGIAIPAEVQFEPSSTAHVGPLVSGRITKVAVALGDRVKRGQLLGVVASSDVSEARARLDQARARLSAAEATLARQQQLTTEGIGAQRSLIEAEARVGELRAEVEGVRRQLSVFGSGSAGELTLTAPIDGVVVAVEGTLGETVTPDQPAFIVTDPTKVWVRGNVPELELSRVRSGSAAVVRMHAFPEASMPGTITYVAPALDERTRSLPIRVSLATPDPRLRSGLFGSIELVGGSADERVVVVPADAVATLEGQSVVFVPADEPNSFRPEAIELGRRAGAWFEVKSGLQEGAPIAISGAFTLKSALRSGELSEGHEH